MSSESEKSTNPAPATPRPYFWGDMPEEEYYTSQGVRNTKSYFETPNGKLFTQSFLPLDGEIKGTVYMSHGYGSDTSWMFQKICMNFATWGYAVFAADLLGHGRSDGIRCYVGSFLSFSVFVLLLVFFFFLVQFWFHLFFIFIVFRFLVPQVYFSFRLG